MSALFAGLLAVAQGGLGRQAGIIAPMLHHESRLFQSSPVDARRQRIDRMTEQAAAERTSGRSSRLDPHPRAGGQELGPRGHRLAIEKQDHAEKLPAQPTDPADGARRHPLTQKPPADGPASARSADPRRDGEPKPPAGELSAGRAVERHHSARRFDPAGTARSGDGHESPPRDSGTVSRPATELQSPSGSGLLRPPDRPAAIARQVAELLASRLEGGRGARAGTANEQVAAARAASGPTQTPSATPKRGRGGSAQTPSSAPTAAKDAEATRRSAFQRLVQSMRLQVSPNRSTVRLRLSPPELGWMRIEARVEGGGVQLSIQTETAAAAELLRARIGNLHAALEQHGLRIDRFELTLAQTQEPQNPDRGYAETGEGHADRSSPDTDAGGQAPGRQGAAGSGQQAASVTGDDQEDGAEPLPEVAAETRLDVRI